MNARLNKPLAGIVVLDLSRVISGPACCLHLADLGAEVIKIEPPGGDLTRRLLPLSDKVRDGRLFFPFNRDKKSVGLDIFSRQGREIFLKLVERADVLVHNFRPGKMDKQGLDYETLDRINPGLIYCAISGYSSHGPSAARAGLDFAIQAESGLMSLTGLPDGEPLKVATSVTDLQAASFGAMAICAALFSRERDGRGRLIEATLFGAGVSLLAESAWDWLLAGRLPQRVGNRGTIPTVLTRYFRTQDGGLVLTVPTQKMWDSFCQVEEFRHLAADPRFARSVDWPGHLAELEAELAGIFPTRSTGQWLELLAVQRGLICAPVRSLDEVFADPEVKIQGLVHRVEHPLYGAMDIPGPAFQMPQTPLAAERPAPSLGQHTEEILGRRLGLSPAELEEMRSKKVIG